MQMCRHSKYRKVQRSVLSKQKRINIPINKNLKILKKQTKEIVTRSDVCAIKLFCFLLLLLLCEVIIKFYRQHSFVCLRPRPNISGNFLTLNFYFADSKILLFTRCVFKSNLPVHTYPDSF